MNSTELTVPPSGPLDCKIAFIGEAVAKILEDIVQSPPGM